MAGEAVHMVWTETGQELWWHTGNGGVNMDGGEHLIALTQQTVEHQQGQRSLCRVGIYDNVTESTMVLI